MALPEKILGGLERLAARRAETLGSRAPEGAKAMDQRRIETAKEPFRMAGSSKLKPIEIISNPRADIQRGRALDLNALGEWDLAHFDPLERMKPTKISERVKEAYKPENVRDFERYVRKGVNEGGLEWYDMSPISRPALQEMSPEDFRVLMAMNAATSARSTVADQIKRASLAWYYRKQGIPWPMTSGELADVADPGYGHLAHEIHSKHLAPLVRGEAPNFSSVDQPKYASYFHNFLGNMAPLTADTHYQALHGFPMKESYNKYNKTWVEAPDFSKNVDYPFAEAFSGDRARRMGIPLPLYQASAWVGGRAATGVRDARPFAAVYDDIIARTADQMDITPLEALKKHLRGEIPLLPIERAEGGRVGYSGGGKVAGLEALTQYLRYRLPHQYGKEKITPLDKGEYGVGSGRKLFAVGHDKVAKIAASPQGLYEQGLEGEHSGVQPGLFWRSPENEITLLERLRHTPEISAGFMAPLQAKYLLENQRQTAKWAAENQTDFARASAGIPGHRDKWWPERASWHRDTPEIAELMREKGMEKFLGDDVLVGDFFNRPHEHWAMRPAPMFSTDPNEKWKATPVLLDAGARSDKTMNRSFLNETQSGPFRDMITNRIHTMDPGMKGRELDYYTAVPEMFQRSFGLGRNALPEAFGFDKLNPDEIGGSLEAMKKRLGFAGGGVVRNWLRGVKGSVLDEALNNLKKRLPLRIPEGEQTGQFAGEEFKRDSAIANWVDKNLANYLVRQYGAGQGVDPLHETWKAVEDPRHMRIERVGALKAINPSDIPGHLDISLVPRDKPIYAGYGPSPKKRAEVETERVRRLGEFKKQLPAWLQKEIEWDELRATHKPHLKAERQLYDLDEGQWNELYAPKFHDMLDWMRQSDIPPERLSRVSVPDAFKASKEWHEQMEKAAQKATLEKIAPENAHKSYPNGWRWIEMSHPDPSTMEVTDWENARITNEKLAQEIGKQLGHCYQDPATCSSYLSNSKLYSLLDPSGKPHATLQATPYAHARSQNAYNRLPQEIKDAYQAHFDSTGKHSMDFGRDFPQWLEANYPDFHKNPPMNIEQIRGPQFKYEHAGKSYPSSMVNDEAKPYVQDFIRSGKWGDVREASNAGLKKIGRHFMTTEEAAPFRRYRWRRELGDERNNPMPTYDWLTEDEWIAKNRENPQIVGPDGNVRADEETRAALRSRVSGHEGFWRYEEVPDDWKPQGFAEGGMVDAADPQDPAEEQLMRAKFALNLLQEELQHTEDETEKAAIAREIQRLERLIAKIELTGVAGQLGVKDTSLISSAAPDVSAPAEGDDEMLGLIMGDPGEQLLAQLMAGES